MYAAQEIPQIDTEIAQKGHFRMETQYKQGLKGRFTDYGDAGNFKDRT